MPVYTKILPAAFALSTLSALITGPAQGEVSRAAFSEQYRSIVATVPSQAQVVYYRLGEQGEKASAAHIYIDGEFHTSLLPGGYTTFCLAPGKHGLNAVFNDEPGYMGKHEQPGAELKAGQTLFLRVDEQFGPLPVLVDRKVAEKEVADKLRQVHVKSRASAVQSCGAESASSQKA